MSLRNTKIKTETEIKEWWCKHGEKQEYEFVSLMSHLSPHMRLQINPKKNIDPTACDLLMGTALLKCDLKCQRTPFFSANKYNLDPKYTFTFNSKDLFRYKELYSDIKIFIWIDWQQTSLTLGKRSWQVEPFKAIYRVNFEDITHLADTGKAPLHHYQRRPSGGNPNHPLHGHIDDKGNATASYLIDLRMFTPLVNLSDLEVSGQAREA